MAGRGTASVLHEGRCKCVYKESAVHKLKLLRVDEMRIFYDVNDSDVVIMAIMTKERTIQWLEEHGEK